MRRLVTAALLVAAGFATAAPVPESPPLVQGPLPTFVNLSQAKIDGKTIKGTLVTHRAVNKAVQEVVDVGGQKVTRTKTVTEMVPVTTSFTYALDHFDVVTADGKTLSLEAALPLLKGTPLVLVSEAALDPAFQKVLARDALILVRKKPPEPK